MVQCPDCKLVATEDDVAQNSNACPGCDRPFAHQPNPTLDEMEHGLRGMPTSTMDDMSGNPLTEGTLGDWQMRGVRDESFASVRTAEFALPGQEQAQPQTRFDTRFPTHQFLVHADGSVYDAAYPTSHEEIAATLGNAQSHLNTGSLGRLFGTGEAAFVSNGSRLAPEELGKALSDHYGRPIEVDPNDPALGIKTQEERFGLTPQGVGPELQTLYSPAKPRVSPRQPIPGETEGLVRGGKTAELAELPMETTQVALPGQHTEEVQPHKYLGLHGDVTGALAQLGAYVNGQPVSDPQHAAELQKHWSGSSGLTDSEWAQNQGQPIMLSHHDPKLLNLAKQVVTTGTSEPMRDFLMDKEAGHQAHIQIPHGITDNLHRTLGNLQAWVENPYDNGELRPYYNKYWKSIRPKFQSPGAINVGVADPQMAEIINHVAQRDDMAPLYKYRGVTTSAQKHSFWPLVGLAARALPMLMRGAMGSGIAGQVGKGMMMGTGMQAGQELLGGGGAPQQQQQPAPGTQQPLPPATQPESFFTHVTGSGDYESPGTHPEFPKVEDADTHQRNDGDSGPNISDDVNDIGGTDTGPNGLFSEDGAGVERFLSLLPLVMHYFNSEESGASDPMIEGLHKSLEMESPGYQEQGEDDEEAANKLIMMVMGDEGEGEEQPPQQDEDTDDDTSNEHDNPEDKDALRFEERVSFLPHLSIVPPGIPGFSAPIQPPPDMQGEEQGQMLAQPGTPAPSGMPGQADSGQTGPNTMEGQCPHCSGHVDPTNTNCPQCGAAAMGLPQHPYPVQASIVDQSIINGPVTPEEEALQTSSWPETGKPQYCPNCQSPTNIHLGMCPHCGEEVFPNAEAQIMQRSAGGDNQGPNTDEQKAAVAELLTEQGRGEEIPKMIIQPWDYADELAQVTQTDTRPEGQPGQPEPAMEEAPPQDTMPVPPMSAPDQQMMGAVQRYATSRCPECDSHTTDTFGEDGHSKCHSCRHVWKDDAAVKPVSAKVAYDDSLAEANPTRLPAADRDVPQDISMGQDASHTWVDEGGNPLIKGQEYDMYSAKYDIPDKIRVESVKPDAITYTIVGEHGLEHSTEISHEEADIENISFVPTDPGAEETPTDDISGMETNDDNNTPYEGSPEQTDLSRPHMSSIDEEELDPRRSWIFEGGSQVTGGKPPPTWQTRTAGAAYTPHEQRQFIDERGTARNADKLNLAGTHYEDEATEDDFIFGF